MSQPADAGFDELVERSARALTTIGPLLPTSESAQSVLAQLSEARARGYFMPDEDELVRTRFSSYLTTRAALQSVLNDLRP